MFGFFAWFRLQIKHAVLGGVQDALTDLDAQEGADMPDVLESLKGRMNALPAASSNGDGKTAKKVK